MENSRLITELTNMWIVADQAQSTCRELRDYMVEMESRKEMTEYDKKQLWRFLLVSFQPRDIEKMQRLAEQYKTIAEELHDRAKDHDPLC